MSLFLYPRWGYTDISQ